MAEVLVLVAWLFPFAALVYLLRAVHTVVLGIRSINHGVQRVANAVERMEERGTGPV